MIHTLSPLDGRYSNKVAELAPIFSEFGLVRARTQVEIAWLLFLSEKKISPSLSASAKKKLEKLSSNFSEKDFQAVKKIEATTNHDVKAVELFLRKYVPKSHWSWIHFACTSEDINNTAYGLILQEGRKVMLAEAEKVRKDLQSKTKRWANIPMLSRTHGQTATPTTLGKELAVFVLRYSNFLVQIEDISITAKLNGATGNYAAHVSAFPKVDWIKLSDEFITQKLKLTWNPLTTQIEPHDQVARLLSDVGLSANVLIDLCRDVWGYISLGYFGQKVVQGEVGSSTMPHKVNPIDFENAEGNLKLARGIAQTLANELPISRWQRDLTDSTLQRNIGLVFGHYLLALKSLEKGLGKLELRKSVLTRDLRNAPEVLTEAVQTVLRAHGHADAYDQLKKFSRGQVLTLEQIREFIQQTKLPETEKKRLLTLTPEIYTGMSEKLVKQFMK